MTDEERIERAARVKRGGWIGRFVRQRRQWRDHVRRVKALPTDYRFVLEQIERFMWSFATDAQMGEVLEDILALFEDGAASGREVLEVTGEDVAAFCQAVLSEIRSSTWTGRKAEDLNRAIADHARKTASSD
ncbi:MAG: DUF1048 domain-containing protein [Bifidobacteriaceae bacterium]|jgi:DNA-binding ferritin-like protein (Dps family)|nr:DUF1048 domain-containing protein [Bifidobacteriaceae bacterium]